MHDRRRTIADRARAQYPRWSWRAGWRRSAPLLCPFRAQITSVCSLYLLHAALLQFKAPISRVVGGVMHLSQAALSVFCLIRLSECEHELACCAGGPAAPPNTPFGPGGIFGVGKRLPACHVHTTARVGLCGQLQGCKALPEAVRRVTPAQSCVLQLRG